MDYGLKDDRRRLMLPKGYATGSAANGCRPSPDELPSEGDGAEVIPLVAGRLSIGHGGDRKPLLGVSYDCPWCGRLHWAFYWADDPGDVPGDAAVMRYTACDRAVWLRLDLCRPGQDYHELLLLVFDRRRRRWRDDQDEPLRGQASTRARNRRCMARR